MPSIFSKNCVLSGCIDYYCLICEAQFRTEEETLDHISESQHKDKWKSCGYFEKYKHDFIKKIKGLYFCELCNMTFPTATKVGLHVDEQTHTAEKDKRNQFLKRVKDDIVVMDKYLIKEEAWNGFVDDTCVLCNTEFDDVTTHKAGKSHILNLIKNNVVDYQYSNSAYRRIDARSTQCLICNKIFNENFSIHSESAAHKNCIIYVTSNYEIANNGKDTKPDNKTNQETVVDKDVKEEIEKTKLKSSVASTKRNNIPDVEVVLNTLGAKNYVVQQEGQQWCILCEWLIIGRPEEHIRSKHHQTLLKMHKDRLETNTDSKNTAAGDGTKSKLFDLFDNFQKNSVNINLINETATCKKCLKNIEFNIDAIERHIEEHNNTVNTKSQENAVPLPSGMKSTGTDKTTLYTKPVLLSAGKEKPPSCSPKASSAADVEDFAKQHGLSHNRADKSYYCNVCCRRLPTTLKDLEKHVSSSGHKDKITEQSYTNTQQNVKKATDKILITKFIENFETVQDLKSIFIVINNKYWMNFFGFWLIARNLFDTIVCHACNIDLTTENVMQHLVSSKTHEQVFEKCFVIASLENEFVREIKPDVYHCGYCNGVVHDWDDLLEHLETKEHERSKSEAQHRLRNHTPNPNNQRNMREMRTMFNSLNNKFGFRFI